MPTILKPNSGVISAPIPYRTLDRGLIDFPELDATVSNVFLYYGYSPRQTPYQNLLMYMPLILLDHAYHDLQTYRDYFKPVHREKQLVNHALHLFRQYFSIILSSKNDDVMQLLDDMDEMQHRFTLQYTFLRYNLQNNNFRRRVLTDDQSRKYGHLVCIVTQLVHATHITQACKMIVDKSTKQILDYVEGPLFDFVIPGCSKMMSDDSRLSNQTIILVNNIIAARLDELKKNRQPL